MTIRRRKVEHPSRGIIGTELKLSHRKKRKDHQKMGDQQALTDWDAYYRYYYGENYSQSYQPSDNSRNETANVNGYSLNEPDGSGYQAYYYNQPSTVGCDQVDNGWNNYGWYPIAENQYQKGPLDADRISQGGYDHRDMDLQNQNVVSLSSANSHTMAGHQQESVKTSELPESQNPQIKPEETSQLIHHTSDFTQPENSGNFGSNSVATDQRDGGHVQGVNNIEPICAQASVDNDLKTQGNCIQYNVTQSSSNQNLEYPSIYNPEIHVKGEKADTENLNKDLHQNYWTENYWSGWNWDGQQWTNGWYSASDSDFRKQEFQVPKADIGDYQQKEKLHDTNVTNTLDINPTDNQVPQMSQVYQSTHMDDRADSRHEQRTGTTLVDQHIVSSSEDYHSECMQSRESSQVHSCGRLSEHPDETGVSCVESAPDSSVLRVNNDWDWNGERFAHTTETTADFHGFSQNVAVSAQEVPNSSKDTVVGWEETGWPLMSSTEESSFVGHHQMSDINRDQPAGAGSTVTENPDEKTTPQVLSDDFGCAMERPQDQPELNGNCLVETAPCESEETFPPPAEDTQLPTHVSDNDSLPQNVPPAANDCSASVDCRIENVSPQLEAECSVVEGTETTHMIPNHDIVQEEIHTLQNSEDMTKHAENTQLLTSGGLSVPSEWDLEFPSEDEDPEHSAIRYYADRLKSSSDEVPDDSSPHDAENVGESSSVALSPSSPAPQIEEDDEMPPVGSNSIESNLEKMFDKGFSNSWERLQAYEDEYLYDLQVEETTNGWNDDLDENDGVENSKLVARPVTSVDDLIHKSLNDSQSSRSENPWQGEEGFVSAVKHDKSLKAEATLIDTSAKSKTDEDDASWSHPERDVPSDVVARPSTQPGSFSIFSPTENERSTLNQTAKQHPEQQSSFQIEAPVSLDSQKGDDLHFSWNYTEDEWSDGAVAGNIYNDKLGGVFDIENEAPPTKEADTESADADRMQSITIDDPRLKFLRDQSSIALCNADEAQSSSVEVNDQIDYNDILQAEAIDDTPEKDPDQNPPRACFRIEELDEKSLASRHNTEEFSLSPRHNTDDFSHQAENSTDGWGAWGDYIEEIEDPHVVPDDSRDSRTIKANDKIAAMMANQTASSTSGIEEFSQDDDVDIALRADIHDFVETVSDIRDSLTLASGSDYGRLRSVGDSGSLTPAIETTTEVSTSSQALPDESCIAPVHPNPIEAVVQEASNRSDNVANGWDDDNWSVDSPHDIQETGPSVHESPRLHHIPEKSDAADPWSDDVSSAKNDASNAVLNVVQHNTSCNVEEQGNTGRVNEVQSNSDINVGTEESTDWTGSIQDNSGWNDGWDVEGWDSEPIEPPVSSSESKWRDVETCDASGQETLSDNSVKKETVDRERTVCEVRVDDEVRGSVIEPDCQSRVELSREPKVDSRPEPRSDKGFSPKIGSSVMNVLEIQDVLAAVKGSHLTEESADLMITPASESSSRSNGIVPKPVTVGIEEVIDCVRGTSVDESAFDLRVPQESSGSSWNQWVGVFDNQPQEVSKSGYSNHIRAEDILNSPILQKSRSQSENPAREEPLNPQLLKTSPSFAKRRPYNKKAAKIPNLSRSLFEADEVMNQSTDSVDSQVPVLGRSNPQSEIEEIKKMNKLATSLDMKPLPDKPAFPSSESLSVGKRHVDLDSQQKSSLDRGAPEVGGLASDQQCNIPAPVIVTSDLPSAFPDSIQKEPEHLNPSCNSESSNPDLREIKDDELREVENDEPHRQESVMPVPSQHTDESGAHSEKPPTATSVVDESGVGRNPTEANTNQREPLTSSVRGPVRAFPPTPVGYQVPGAYGSNPPPALPPQQHVAEYRPSQYQPHQNGDRRYLSPVPLNGGQEVYSGNDFDNDSRNHSLRRGSTPLADRSTPVLDSYYMPPRHMTPPHFYPTMQPHSVPLYVSPMMQVDPMMQMYSQWQAMYQAYVYQMNYAQRARRALVSRRNRSFNEFSVSGSTSGESSDTEDDDRDDLESRASSQPSTTVSFADQKSSTPKEVLPAKSRNAPTNRPRVFARFSASGALVFTDILNAEKSQIFRCSQLESAPEELKQNTGPFHPLTSRKSDARKYLAARVNEASAVGDMDSVLLLNYLTILVQQNGFLLGSDVSEMLSQFPYGAKHQMDAESPTFDASEENGVESGTMDEIRELLVFRRHQDLIRLASRKQHWGLALRLTSMIDQSLHEKTCNDFDQHFFSKSDVLKTFISVKTFLPLPQDVLENCRFDWQRHLAAILANKTENHAFNCSLICQLGDALYERGCCVPAQLCYILAEVSCSLPSDPNCRFTLIGADSTDLECLRGDITAIVVTMILEYAVQLKFPTYCIPSLQIFKLFLAQRLFDIGDFDGVVSHLENIALNIGNSPIASNRALVHAVGDLFSRVPSVAKDLRQTELINSLTGSAVQTPAHESTAQFDCAPMASPLRKAPSPRLKQGPMGGAATPLSFEPSQSQPYEQPHAVSYEKPQPDAGTGQDEEFQTPNLPADTSFQPLPDDRKVGDTGGEPVATFKIGDGVNGSLPEDLAVPVMAPQPMRAPDLQPTVTNDQFIRQQVPDQAQRSVIPQSVPDQTYRPPQQQSEAPEVQERMYLESARRHTLSQGEEEPTVLDLGVSRDNTSPRLSDTFDASQSRYNFHNFNSESAWTSRNSVFSGQQQPERRRMSSAASVSEKSRRSSYRDDQSVRTGRSYSSDSDEPDNESAEESSAQPSPRKEPDTPVAKPIQKKSSVIDMLKPFGKNIIGRIIPNRKNQMHLPDDSNSDFYWDPVKKKWVDATKPDKEEEVPPPPPMANIAPSPSEAAFLGSSPSHSAANPLLSKASQSGGGLPPQPAAAGAANPFAARGGLKRSRYVDLVAQSGRVMDVKPPSLPTPAHMMAGPPPQSMPNPSSAPTPSFFNPGLFPPSEPFPDPSDDESHEGQTIKSS